MMCAVPGKQFVCHFDYVINDSRTVRLSLSNIYKEMKVRIIFTVTLCAPSEHEWDLDPSSLTGCPRVVDGCEFERALAARLK